MQLCRSQSFVEGANVLLPVHSAIPKSTCGRRNISPASKMPAKGSSRKLKPALIDDQEQSRLTSVDDVGTKPQALIAVPRTSTAGKVVHGVRQAELHATGGVSKPNASQKSLDINEYDSAYARNSTLGVVAHFSFSQRLQLNDFSGSRAGGSASTVDAPAITAVGTPPADGNGLVTSTEAAATAGASGALSFQFTGSMFDIAGDRGGAAVMHFHTDNGTFPQLVAGQVQPRDKLISPSRAAAADIEYLRLVFPKRCPASSKMEAWFNCLPAPTLVTGDGTGNDHRAAAMATASADAPAPSSSATGAAGIRLAAAMPSDFAASLLRGYFQWVQEEIAQAHSGASSSAAAAAGGEDDGDDGGGGAAVASSSAAAARTKRTRAGPLQFSWKPVSSLPIDGGTLENASAASSTAGSVGRRLELGANGLTLVAVRGARSSPPPSASASFAAGDHQHADAGHPTKQILEAAVVWITRGGKPKDVKQGGQVVTAKQISKKGTASSNSEQPSHPSPPGHALSAAAYAGAAAQQPTATAAVAPASAAQPSETATDASQDTTNVGDAISAPRAPSSCIVVGAMSLASIDGAAATAEAHTSSTNAAAGVASALAFGGPMWIRLEPAMVITHSNGSVTIPRHILAATAASQPMITSDNDEAKDATPRAVKRARLVQRLGLAPMVC